MGHPPPPCLCGPQNGEPFETPKQLLSGLHGPALGLELLGGVPDPAKSGSCCGAPPTAPPSRPIAEMDSSTATSRLAVLGRGSGCRCTRWQLSAAQYSELGVGQTGLLDPADVRSPQMPQGL